MSTQLSTFIQSLFVKAGWRPGRSVPVALSDFCDAPVLPAAARLLSEFGGLHVFPESRMGEDCVTADVHLDPRLSAHETDKAREWMPRIGSRLFPLGEAQDGYLMLFVDENERVFETDIVACDFCLVGESFPSAMDNLLLGYHLRPLLPPGAEGIEGYGQWFAAGDDRIYDPTRIHNKRNASEGT